MGPMEIAQFTVLLGETVFAYQKRIDCIYKYNYLVHVGVSSNNLLAPHQLKGTLAILMFDNNSNGYWLIWG